MTAGSGAGRTCEWSRYERVLIWLGLRFYCNRKDVKTIVRATRRSAECSYCHGSSYIEEWHAGATAAERLPCVECAHD